MGLLLILIAVQMFLDGLALGELVRPATMIAPP